ncbi:hypothetical protein TNCV_797771 [Trichonephila clavipes]|nr:hypothetical protein TNCV_797771 [Trichonephila clavipes]
MTTRLPRPQPRVEVWSLGYNNWRAFGSVVHGVAEWVSYFLSGRSTLARFITGSCHVKEDVMMTLIVNRYLVALSGTFTMYIAYNPYDRTRDLRFLHVVSYNHELVTGVLRVRDLVRQKTSREEGAEARYICRGSISSLWCGVEVRRGFQLRGRPRRLIEVQND